MLRSKGFESRRQKGGIESYPDSPAATCPTSDWGVLQVGSVHLDLACRGPFRKRDLHRNRHLLMASFARTAIAVPGLYEQNIVFVLISDSCIKKRAYQPRSWYPRFCVEEHF